MDHTGLPLQTTPYLPLTCERLSDGCPPSWISENLSFWTGSPCAVDFPSRPSAIFTDLAWNAYWRPQNFEPLNVIGHHRDPQKAHPWPKPHLHANVGADRSTGATWAPAEGIKKEKRARKETYSGKLSVRPDHPRWRSDMWSACRALGGSYKFQVSSKSVERFSRCGGRNLPFLIPKVSGL